MSNSSTVDGNSHAPILDVRDEGDDTRAGYDMVTAPSEVKVTDGGSEPPRFEGFILFVPAKLRYFNAGEPVKALTAVLIIDRE